MQRRLISSGSSFEAVAGYSRAVVDGDCVHVAGTTGFDYAKMSIDTVRPAATAIVCGLVDARMAIEIEVTARLPR